MTRTQPTDRLERGRYLAPEFAFDAHARLTDPDTGDEVLAEGPAILTAEGGWMLATDSAWAEIQRALRTGEPLRLRCNCDSHLRPNALRVKRFVAYSDTLEVEPITNDADPAEHQGRNPTSESEGRS
ncbi:MAG: hypothetical protein ABEK03_02495 [Candidatus Bipolaricaulia bacterium]